MRYTRYEQRFTSHINEYATCCADCFGALAVGDIIVKIDADTDDESVLCPACAVERVRADNQRRRALTLVK